MVDTKPYSTAKDVFEEFLRIEKDYNAFEIEWNGVPVWEFIRFQLYRELRGNVLRSEKAHETPDPSFLNHLKGVRLWIKHSIQKNPLFSNPHDFLFYGHKRRQFRKDKTWWDIYFDPIHQNLNLDSVHVEEPYNLGHRTPPRTENIKYLDFIEFSGAIQRKLKISSIDIEKNELPRLSQINNELIDSFGIEIDCFAIAELILSERDSLQPLYNLLLDRIDPVAVPIVVAYGRESFIEVCKKRDIPVIEFQHGIIHQRHIGYSYPKSEQIQLFPDFLLTFGEFWNEQAQIPLPNERVISVGYPFLEEHLSQNESPGGEVILFISQGPVGTKLAHIAVEFVEKVDQPIIYKLHPQEYERKENVYSTLLDSEIHVVGENGPELYELFKMSSSQIGAYSTAIYEGLAFGLDTYLLECNRSHVMNPLLDEDFAVSFQDSDDLLKLYSSSTQTDIDTEKFFKSNSLGNVQRVLEKFSK